MVGGWQMLVVVEQHHRGWAARGPPDGGGSPVPELRRIINNHSKNNADGQPPRARVCPDQQWAGGSHWPVGCPDRRREAISAGWLVAGQLALGPSFTAPLLGRFAQTIDPATHGIDFSQLGAETRSGPLTKPFLRLGHLIGGTAAVRNASLAETIATLTRCTAPNPVRLLRMSRIDLEHPSRAGGCIVGCN
ncbi:hypothetical protein BO78DRAFT_223824 [Aspergillus sclerotiicarbonarius CBS 121057]|uniref:Uncharacterized protein n=1 Tax=Aspergillus sclerotiicarbonarius (strain CBS 121057 / IBT 28362) TaxID=1448318 RepID=A0A319EEW3_ASPSB|nr:hypothetical protein BO78DRAFT_223824 [Aspergillus sclerotiicarbonarius CBS 121057]